MSTKNFVYLLCCLLFAGTLSAQKYIGAEKCKMCHNKKEKGEQYNQWLSTTHSTAMKSLKSPKAMEWAKANNVADPSKEAKCIKCHATTGTIDASLISGITEAEGVSCESCHGPGSGYKAPTVMKDKELAMEKGLIMPTEKVCLKCHVASEDSPFDKPFDFATYNAKITHPNPKK
jgi:hypothetical protein